MLNFILYTQIVVNKLEFKLLYSYKQEIKKYREEKKKQRKNKTDLSYIGSYLILNKEEIRLVV